jgi:hypothetical protein
MPAKAFSNWSVNGQLSTRRPNLNNPDGGFILTLSFQTKKPRLARFFCITEKK